MRVTLGRQVIESKKSQQMWQAFHEGDWWQLEI